MKKGETINENVREFIQEWFVKPQLLDSDSNDTSEREGGLKDFIQKSFVKYAVVNWDNLKAILEDDDDMNALYEAIEKRESSTVARQVFTDAISEAQQVIAAEFGMGPRRKKPHEILAEQLEEKYGEDAINKNINQVIQKNIGNGGEADCEGGC